ncbi:MAG: LysE family translocator [Magnetospirillum sp.]|nr:LysE family translocator [Magnetospirillum sp.]
MPLDPAQFTGFLAAAILITLAPGPDNLMVLSLGVARGRRQGMAFGLGCAVGCLSHTALAALGVSAIIAASPWAFLALKLAGGLYLAWLGIQMLRHPDLGAAGPAGSGENAWRLFRRGLVANAVNPKVILFFLAFLPQFVQAGRGAVAGQTLALGLTFTVQAAVLFCLLGACAGQLGRVLSRRPAMGRWLNRLAGLTFLGVGARLALGR